LKEIVTKLGYARATEVENGEEAIQSVMINKYDVILLDLKMPIMNGYTFFEKLKTLHKSKRIDDIPYTIALTASAMTSDKQRCLEMGMNQYLAKPLDIGELRNILQSF
jgi:CheY-like chemotaxis protein